MELREQRWIEGLGSGGEGMGGRRKSHDEGHKRASECLDSRVEGRKCYCEGKAGGHMRSLT